MNEILLNKLFSNNSFSSDEVIQIVNALKANEKNDTIPLKIDHSYDDYFKCCGVDFEEHEKEYGKVKELFKDYLSVCRIDEGSDIVKLSKVVEFLYPIIRSDQKLLYVLFVKYIHLVIKISSNPMLRSNFDPYILSII